MTNSKACLGFFDVCVLETILTGWIQIQIYHNIQFTLALLEKSHLAGKQWSEQYAMEY